MLKRVITTLVGLPILLWLIQAGGIWLQASLLLLSLIGLYEFYGAVSKRPLGIHLIGYAFAVLYFLTLPAESLNALLTLLIGLVLIIQLYWVIFWRKCTLMDCLATLFGFLYVPFLLSFIYLVRVHPFGLYFVWLIFTSASGSDTFAYLVGRKWGRRKLHGSPSPGKTLEGCVGGIAGAALVGLVYGLFVDIFLDMGQPMVLNAVAVSAAAALCAQFGDLFASAVKRAAGIKDFGKILPGHGGILDRFDSVIATGPVVFMLMLAMVQLGEI